MSTRLLSFRTACVFVCVFVCVCVRVGMRVCARVTPSRAQSWIRFLFYFFARTVDPRWKCDVNSDKKSTALMRNKKISPQHTHNLLWMSLAQLRFLSSVRCESSGGSATDVARRVSSATPWSCHRVLEPRGRQASGLCSNRRDVGKHTQRAREQMMRRFLMQRALQLLVAATEGCDSCFNHFQNRCDARRCTEHACRSMTHCMGFVCI